MDFASAKAVRMVKKQEDENRAMNPKVQLVLVNRAAVTEDPVTKWRRMGCGKVGVPE